MSRRLPASPLAVLTLLLAGSLLVPLLARSAAAYGERVQEGNTVIGGGDPSLTVYSDQTIAQSFTATRTYSLLNLTLRLLNNGSSTNPITVTIRPDDPTNHTPTNSILASSRVVTPNNVLGQWDIPFSPAPALIAGRMYWIVAANPSPQTKNGYEWHHSGANVYAGGWAEVYNATTSSWASLLTDMYFVTYGRDLAANVSVGMTVSPPQASPRDSVTFTVYFNNSGTQDASIVWINDTLPSGFAYVSDTSGSIVPRSTTPFPSFTFNGVSNGVHSFTITLRVEIGVAPATVLTNVVNLTYANATVVIESGKIAQASVFVGMEAKQLYLAPSSVLPRQLTHVNPVGSSASQVVIGRGNFVDFALTPALAREFRTQNLSAYLWVDSQSGNARPLQLDASFMDRNGTLVLYQQTSILPDNTPGFQLLTMYFNTIDYTFPAGHQIQLRILNDNAGSQDDLVVAFNSTAYPSRLNLLTTTYTSIDSVSLRDQSGPATVWSPMDALIVQANLSDPFGSAAILGAWINVTGPSGSLLTTFVPMTLLQIDPLNPSAWKLFEYVFNQTLTNGTYRIDVTSIEDNSVEDVAESVAIVRSPQFLFAKVASIVRASGGDRFVYSLWFDNTGAGAAERVWINDTFPTELNFLSSSSPPVGNYNWSWTTLSSGSHRLDIDVEVKTSATQVGWIRNGATLSYTDEKGHLWPVQAASADVYLNGPVVNLSLTSDPPSTVHANQLVTYTIAMANPGGTARDLWVNDTLPAGFTYVSDSAATFGGTSALVGDEVQLHLTNMTTDSTWPVTIVARAGPLSGSPTITNNVSVTYSSTTGDLMPPERASLSLTASSPRITQASIWTIPVQAVPGGFVPAVLNYTNAGNEHAASVWVNLTLDPYLVFVNASSPGAASGTDLRLTLADVAVGSWQIFVNFSVANSVPDQHTMTISGTLNYTDGYGNLLPSVAVSPDSVLAIAPRIVLGVVPGNVTVEAGTMTTFAIYHANAGSGTAGDVWLNLSLPAGFVYVSDTAGGTLTVAGTRYGWRWTNQAPGPASYNLVLAAKTTVTDGAGVDLVFHTDYTDENGNGRNGTTVTVHATFVAPVITLDLLADKTDVLAGGDVSYTLHASNVGSATARNLWLLDSVDNRLEIVSYTSRVAATGSPNLNWTFLDFLPGQSEEIVLVARAQDGLPARILISNVFEAVYTNSIGTVVGYARSAPVTMRIMVDLSLLPYIFAGGIALGTAAVIFVRRRQHIEIEDAFLVYRDGVLMYHLSRSLVQDKDEDVLSGMLTAVQEFVRDAFRYGEHRELHQLDFGDYRIMIERGKNVYLAVVHSGSASPHLRKKVRGVLDHIETTYGSVLEKWDGDMDKVVGARDAIRDYLLKPNGRHHRPAAKAA